METFNLNLIPGKNNPVVHASQFDEGRVIRVNLFEGSSVYTLDGTEVITISVRKSDGHIVTEAITNTSDSYVEIVTTEQMTACAGSNLCELKIEKGSDVIGTLNFILEVEVDPLDGGDPSESFIHDLNAQIYAAVADQYDSNNVIFDAAPTPGHGVGYVVTSEGTPDELEDMTDVTYTGSPSSGEALVWDGSKWTNGTVSTVGSIDDLNDVDTTGKAEGDSLRYNATAQEWEAKPTTVEMTLAEYTALGGDYSGYENTNIIITDAPNLNATAQDISYDGGADTVWDKVEEKADTATTYTKSEVDTKLGEKSPIDYFNRYDFSSTKPIVISDVGVYHCFLIIGFVQGIGVLTVVVKITNGTVSTVDFITGTSFSSANISFSYTSGTKKLTITTPQAGGSYLAIMRAGSM